MTDPYRRQADQLAFWLSQGKTLKQASAIVARRAKPRRARRKAKRGHSVMGTLILQALRSKKK